jgi:hypothetical protein
VVLLPYLYCDLRYIMAWKPTHLLEGMEEVWITFTDENDEDITIEVCSVEDLVYRFIGDADDVANKIKEEMMNNE